jgi:serine/threonine-protein kinase
LLKHAGPPSATIAILPFTNLSGDPAQAYFSDGLAEDLRDALSRIAGLSVVARTSSEAVRNDDAKTAAAKLGASDILTGSVRRSSAMLRVSVQLIDGKHGLERWSQVYDQTGGDLLQIESAIADKIADSLSIRLGVTDPKRVQLGGTNNPDAHDLLLKAQSIRGRLFDRDRMQEALELADSAIALDPKYGDALALKASLLSGKAGTFSRNAEEFRVGFAIAERVARQAIAAAPRSPSGYAVLAEIREGQLRLRAASALLSKAAALPGGAAKSLGQYAEFLAFTGRSDEALAKATQLTELDPLNPRAFGTKAEVLGYARRFADAAKTCETAIELSGGIAPARGYHAFCVAMTGDLAAARKELSTVWPDLSQAPTGYVAPLAREDHGLGEQIIAETRKTAGDAAATGYAQIYAQMGRIGAALDQLELAWRVRDPALISLLVDPLCDPLRSEPRFKLLIGQLDFPT